MGREFDARRLHVNYFRACALETIMNGYCSCSWIILQYMARGEPRRSMQHTVRLTNPKVCNQQCVCGRQGNACHNWLSICHTHLAVRWKQVQILIPHSSDRSSFSFHDLDLSGYRLYIVYIYISLICRISLMRPGGSRITCMLYDA